MNESAQLKAIAAELVGSGWGVDRDLPGPLLRIDGDGGSALEGMTLDFVAARKDGSGRVTTLIVEVANRTRRALGPVGPSSRPVARQPYDEEAVARFESIANALADAPNVDFQIRFLDVSAEQAAARLLTTPFRNKELMGKRVVEDRRLLAISSGRDDLSHTLLVVRLWTFWLRVFGNRYPGRDRQEMKHADLRTIQKDLYDARIVEMTPSRYHIVHSGLMAVVEGGDFEPDRIADLEQELRALLKQVAEWYDVRSEFAAIDHSYNGIFGDIQNELREAAITDDVEDAEVSLFVLWLTQGSERFAAEVARFQLSLGGRRLISESLLTALLEQAIR